MSLTMTLAGEEVVLMSDRSLYWPRARTLLVADAHVGKAATFRASGIFVPRGTTTAALGRLDRALARTGATRLIFLGDLLHAREGRSPETLRVVHEWRASHVSLEIVLVRGNHDRSAGDPPDSLRIRCIDAPMYEGPFAFVHYPAVIDGYCALAGHIHPAVRLSGPGRQYMRLPCFWVRESGTVLPAFGDFTGDGIIEPGENDRVFAIAEGVLIDVSCHPEERSDSSCHPEERSDSSCHPEERSDSSCHPEERSDEGSAFGTSEKADSSLRSE